MNTKIKSIIKRFIRAFVAGAAANMIVILSFTGNSWNDLSIWIATLAVSAIVGGISGVVMATDKYLRLK